MIPAPCLLAKLFSRPKISKTLKNSRTKNLRHCETEKLPTDTPYSFPTLICKLFRYLYFSEPQHKKVPLRNVSVVPVKKPRRKKVIPAFLLTIKVSTTRIFLNANTKGSPKELFETVSQQNFDKEF